LRFEVSEFQGALIKDVNPPSDSSLEPLSLLLFGVNEPPLVLNRQFQICYVSLKFSVARFKLSHLTIQLCLLLCKSSLQTKNGLIKIFGPASQRLEIILLLNFHLMIRVLHVTNIVHSVGVNFL